MNENPFESGNNKNNPFDQSQKKSPIRAVAIFGLIIVVLAIIGLIAYPYVVDKYNQYKLEKNIEAIIDGTYSGSVTDLLDLELSDEADLSLKAGAHFVGNQDLLGIGSDSILSQKQVTADVTSPVFIESGNKYRFENVIEPGVYTIKYKSGEDVVFGDNSGLTVIGYSLGSQAEADTMTEFSNITIPADTELFVEAADEFDLEFTSQDEYVEFDQTDITPGVYTAGVNIDAGNFNLGSKTGEPVNITYQTAGKSDVISTADYQQIELEAGDSIIIDNQDTTVEYA